MLDEGFCSSPILVGDRVYIVDLSGTTHIFKMADRFQALGAGAIDEGVYATPAFAGGRIFCRGLFHLFCVEEKD